MVVAIWFYGWIVTVKEKIYVLKVAFYFLLLIAFTYIFLLIGSLGCRATVMQRPQVVFLCVCVTASASASVSWLLLLPAVHCDWGRRSAYSVSRPAAVPDIFFWRAS